MQSTFGIDGVFARRRTTASYGSLMRIKNGLTLEPLRSPMPHRMPGIGLGWGEDDDATIITATAVASVVLTFTGWVELAVPFARTYLVDLHDNEWTLTDDMLIAMFCSLIEQMKINTDRRQLFLK